MLAPNPSRMIRVTITKFTGTGTPEVVVATNRGGEPQSEPKPALRLIRGGLT